jgi:hypothetical protein
MVKHIETRSSLNGRSDTCGEAERPKDGDAAKLYCVSGSG